MSRAIVTDPYGRVLYDTREAGNATGYYVFYTELVSALQGSSAPAIWVNSSWPVMTARWL